MKCIVCENGSVFNQDDDADDWVYCFAVKYIYWILRSAGLDVIYQVIDCKFSHEATILS